jgi:metallo-beta-lactamase class B
MRSYALGLLGAVGLALSIGGLAVGAQADTAQTHIDRARQLAGDDLGVFNVTCGSLQSAQEREAAAARRQAAARGGRGSAPAARQTPGRAEWHADPVKVFDNLYWLGQTQYSAWAVTTSAGIIVIDTLFDYSVEDEVVGGLKTLGLNPADIKYVIVSHGHGDHSGGAKYLQDHFNARVILSAADWDLLDRSSGTRPRRDMVATDGMKLTLGDTTLTLYLTPGHTPGTISTLIPVKDHGQLHLVAEWGGTAFNFTQTRDNFGTYASSAETFRGIVARSGADVIIANHPIFDGTRTKMPALAARKPGDPNPWVVGNEAAQRYVEIAEECAKAGLLTAQ